MQRNLISVIFFHLLFSLFTVSLYVTFNYVNLTLHFHIFILFYIIRNQYQENTLKFLAFACKKLISRFFLEIFVFKKKIASNLFLAYYTHFKIIFLFQLKYVYIYMYCKAQLICISKDRRKKTYKWKDE